MTTAIEFLLGVSGTIVAAIEGGLGGTDGLSPIPVLALIAVGGLIAGVSPSGLTAGMAVVAQFQPEPNGPMRHNGMVIAGAFSLGMVTALAALGVLAVWAGRVVVGLGLARWLPVLPLFMGLNMLGLLRWRWLRSLRGIGAPVSGLGNAFWLGLPFGIATSPCALPVLVTALTMAAAKGQAFFGLAGLLAFGLGRSIPVLLLGLVSDQAGIRRRLDAVAPYVRRATGGLIVTVSVYFLIFGRELLG